MPGPNAYVYPGLPLENAERRGIYPVDFVIETVIRAGLDWFRDTPDAGTKVFGQLTAPWLSKYGASKISEIADYINTTDIKVVQHFSLIDQHVPCFSIQLLDGTEREDRAGLDAESMR